MKQFIIVVLLTLAVQCYSQMNLNATNEYLIEEKSLWNVIVNSTKSGNQKLGQIFKKHEKFLEDSLDLDRSNIDDLEEMIGPLGWRQLRIETISNHRLLTSFRRQLTRDSKITDKKAPVVDFANQILDDSQYPLQKTIENLQKIITESKLFSNEVNVSVRE
jgi:hypothetical protein